MKFLNKIDGADKLITDSAHRTVTDGQISIWDDKLDIVDIADTVERNFDLGDEVSAVPTIDADLLGGKPPSYYLAGGGTGAGSGDMLKIDYDTNENGIVDNAEKVNGFTVEINVPANAKFTDTIYTHPASHPASMITGLPTSLPANGGNAATVGGFTVGVDVPANAVFTDTNTVTSINGKTGAITKADIVALGIPASDTNTTYSAGTNIQINGTTISATDSKRDDSTSEFRVEVRTSDPVSPAIGRMWYRSDL